MLDVPYARYRQLAEALVEKDADEVDLTERQRQGVGCQAAVERIDICIKQMRHGVVCDEACSHLRRCIKRHCELTKRRVSI